MNYPQGGYGPQHGYPPQQQQGWYGPPQPGQYPPPKKNNTALIVAIAGVAVAAIVALVLVLVLTGDDDKKADSGSDSGGQPSAEVPGPNAPGNGGDDNDNGGGSGGSETSSPEALADAVVDIIERQDAGAIDALSCSPSIADELRGELSKLAGMDVTAQVSDVQESGDQAQATIDMEFGDQTEGITIEMEKQDSGWCAAGI